MKGLFQCPPRAAPWVMMDASLSPCKGKSFLSYVKKFFLRKSLKVSFSIENIDLKT